MQINWPLLIAVMLILVKQLHKLFLYHKPDRLDVLKAAASLPIDVSFLVVGLFIKAAAEPESTSVVLVGLMLIYFFISSISMILWRVCDAAVTTKLGGNFFWAFPLNAAVAAAMFYIAIQVVR